MKIRSALPTIGHSPRVFNPLQTADRQRRPWVLSAVDTAVFSFAFFPTKLRTMPASLSPLRLDFPGGSDGKEATASAGDPGLIPRWGRFPREGNDNTVWYCCLENPMDRGAWRATVHGVTRVGHDWATNTIQNSALTLWVIFFYYVYVIFLFNFQLEDNCFTTLYWLLPYINMNQTIQTWDAESSYTLSQMEVLCVGAMKLVLVYFSSLEGLMLKLKLQSFGHLMQRADSLEKTLMMGKIEGGRRRGRQRMRWLDGITDSMDMS